MFLVKVATVLTEVVSSAKLKRAEKKNLKAMNRLRSAKSSFDASNFEMKSTQVNVMMQLTKLNKLNDDIADKAAINSAKHKKLTALLESIED